MTPDQVADWLAAHPLSPVQVDCVVTVMLKILDGKCKMRPAEKQVMALLYDEIKTLPGELLSDDLHPLIAKARIHSGDDALTLLVYEKRLLAETAISRPIMKRFKAFIREQGLLQDKESSGGGGDDDEDG